MDLFSTFFGGNSSSASGQIHPSLPEIPIDNGPPPPTAPSRQFSVSTVAPPKRVPSLQHCILSDGGLDAEKYLHRQVTARKWSLWRTSMALNLIHGVGEYFSAGSKARSLATDLKIPGARMCLWTQRFCGFGIAGHETQRVPVVGYVRE